MQLAGDSAFHARAYPPVPPVQSESHPLISLDESSDEWDIKNQNEMKQLERTQPNSQDLYERFQQMRDIERKQMESKNLVDNHDVRRSLNDAIAFVGSCTEMCPVYERVRREFQRNVKGFERENGRISANLAVKAFSRPAAGQPPALPSDVRPPSVLVKTLEYLLENIVPALPDSHPFLWDRTRSIRQDFTYQNYAGVEAVQCTEIICRIHALCLHVMVGNPDWSQQQELEQFNKSLRTLDEQYSLRPNRTLDQCPSEPEIRGMQLLIRLFDPETAYKIDSLPKHIADHELVRLAMRIRSLVFIKPANPSLYSLFFELVRDPNTPLLYQIICQVHFPTIRANLITGLRKSLHKKSQLYNVERFATILGFDDSIEAMSYFENTKLKVENGNVVLDTWEDSSKLGPTKSLFIERNLDLSLLSSGPNNRSVTVKPLPLNTSSSSSYFKPEELVNKVAVKDDLALSNGSTKPLSINTSSIPRPKLDAPKEIIKQEAQKPTPPSMHELQAYIRETIAAIAGQMVMEAVKAAARTAQQQRYEQQERKYRYMSAIGQQLGNEILSSIVNSAVSSAIFAVRYRRQSLIKSAVSRFKNRLRSVISMARDRARTQNSAQDFITTLTSRSAPKRSMPLQAIKYSTPSPVLTTTPETPIGNNSNMMSVTEDKFIRQAIKSASMKGAKIVMLMADWNSYQGDCLKNIFALDHDYRNMIDNVLVTTDSGDRPDITLNFLDRRLDSYISFEPVVGLINRICKEIENFATVFQVPKLEEISLDDSTNVSIFLPAKRTFSGFAPAQHPCPIKRQSTPRAASRSMSSVEELKKLMEDSKKLIK